MGAVISLWAPDLESVCLLTFPCSQVPAWLLVFPLEESGKKNIPFPYSDLLLFLHGFCKLASRVQKEPCSLKEVAETFKYNNILTKNEIQHLWGFPFPTQCVFYCLYLVVSQIGSYNFFTRHRGQAGEDLNCLVCGLRGLLRCDWFWQSWDCVFQYFEK